MRGGCTATPPPHCSAGCLRTPGRSSRRSSHVCFSIGWKFVVSHWQFQGFWSLWVSVMSLIRKFRNSPIVVQFWPRPNRRRSLQHSLCATTPADMIKPGQLCTAKRASQGFDPKALQHLNQSSVASNMPAIHGMCRFAELHGLLYGAKDPTHGENCSIHD